MTNLDQNNNLQSYLITIIICYLSRLGVTDRLWAGWGLTLLPGQGGEERAGGAEEGQGEAAYGGGKVRYCQRVNCQNPHSTTTQLNLT